MGPRRRHRQGPRPVRVQVAKRDRPGWAELLGALRAGLAQVVIPWESSRGDRKLSEWSAFLDECRERGILIHVICDDRTYDPRIPVDWRTLAGNGVDSAFESEKNSVRVKRGIAGAASRGWRHSYAPYGYRSAYDESTGKRIGWRIVPERADVVREIIRRVGAHDSLKAIRRDLNDRGVPTVRGGPWTDQQIRHMAMNEAYAGLLRLPDGTLGDGQWEPIVDRAAWDEAMAVLGPRRTGKRPGSQRHLLTFLAECGCGSPVVFRSVNGNPRYSCRGGCFYIPEEWLDDFVTDVICERLSRPDARDLFRRDDSRSEALKNELAGLRAQLDEWAAADISVRAYQIKEGKLLPRIQRAERELDGLTLAPALSAILSAGNVRQAWESYTVQARRAVIAAVTGVVVHRGPAPEDVHPGAVYRKVWVRVTGQSARSTQLHATGAQQHTTAV